MTQINQPAQAFQVPFIDVTSDEAIFEGEGWDAVVVIAPSLADIKQDEINLLASHASQIDQRVGNSATLLLAPGLAGGRLIISPVADADNIYNDVRVFAKAAREGIAIAKAKGVYKGRNKGTKEPLSKFLGKPKNLKAIEYLKKGYKKSEVAKIVGLHPSTINKIEKLNCCYI